MKGSRLLRGTAAVGLACWTFASQQAPVEAASPKKETKQATKTAQVTKVVDVTLASGGVVTGQVVNAQGLGLDGAVVSIRQGNREVAQVVTDKNGNFTAENMRGGVYHVVAGQGEGVYRFWTADTAPPSAQPQAMVVSNGKVVRGQSPLGLPVIPAGVTTAAAVGSLGFAGWGAFEVQDLQDDNKKLQDQLRLISKALQ